MKMKLPGKKGDKLALGMIAVVIFFVFSLPFLPVPKHPFNWGFNSRWACTNQNFEVSCQRK